ncbi:hypothetical protein HDU96_009761 [Phlyctochytrium bullatum]|nr:hypothetical protein HDU96_009761 [Phlyctochytrium bullatum]
MLDKIDLTDLRKRINLDRPGSTPYPAWAMSGLFLLSTIPSLTNRPGWPGVFPLIGFAGAYAASGWVTTQDTDQGPSSLTAWGLTYIFLCATDTVKSRKPGPIGLSLAVVGTTAVYAKEFIDGWF